MEMSNSGMDKEGSSMYIPIMGYSAAVKMSKLLLQVKSRLTLTVLSERASH